MLNPADLYRAIQALSPRRRTIYDIAYPLSVALAGAVGALLVGGLSAVLARLLVDADITSEALWAAIVIPAVMAYMFVLASARREGDSALSLRSNMVTAAWRMARIAFGVGFFFVAFIHFLGQLLMARAIYGPLEYQAKVLSYCGLVPVLYGLLFAVPIALGCALFAAYVTASGEWIYQLVQRLPDEAGSLKE